MSIWLFDFEVFKYDWFVVFKKIGEDEIVFVHNDNYQLKQFVTEDKLFVGFNNKHYDNHIMSLLLNGGNNQLVKDLNDFIIVQGKDGWEFPYFKSIKAKGKINRFYSFDVTDDMQKGLSLKSIEAHIGMNVVETPVEFDIDRPLTIFELMRAKRYCIQDVKATEEILKLRKDYMNTKLFIGRSIGLKDNESLYHTNAKLTSLFLNATKKVWNDERNYQYPSTLRRDLIPPEVITFFNQIHDMSITNEILYDKKCEIKLQDMQVVYGWGGVHGGLNNYIEEETTTRAIVNFDVPSLYPSLLIKYNYISRNIPDPSKYETVYDNRLRAKATGDKKTASGLKLVLNTTFGAMLNQYNNLFDPKNGRSVTITGQLLLTQLVIMYLNELKTIRLINFNTDGVMFSIERNELDKVERINNQWKSETRIGLEQDDIKKIIQKDVNNYIAIDTKDSVKTKGGYLTYGISTANAFTVNNSAVIVKKAIIDYFVKGVEPEDTVMNSNALIDFQIIAKAGSKYKEAYHLVRGEKMKVQKVNRVYATDNLDYGTIVKIKEINEDRDQENKIENIPLNCIIDNDNQITIDQVDKSYYVRLAKKRINEFKGIEAIKINKKAINKLKKDLKSIF